MTVVEAAPLTGVGLTAYGAAPGGPAQREVPVTALVLTRDEEPNIARCLASLGWCDQVVVVDSGSTDRTVAMAEAAGATVLENPWPGFAAQRQWAMDHPAVCHDWVFFVDADEWISIPLADEIAAALAAPQAAAFVQRCRVVFLGQWIRHCGWYANFRLVRLMDRRHASWGRSAQFGERAQVEGPVGQLVNDLVDEDLKGLAAWMRKHVGYASLEADRRMAANQQGRAWARVGRRPGTLSFGRAVAKEMVLPKLPMKPAAIFMYMYIARAGWRDGRRGLAFCLLHAWHEHNVGVLMRSRRSGWSPA